MFVCQQVNNGVCMMKIWVGGHFLSLTSGPGRPIGVYFWVKCNSCKKRALAWTQHTNTIFPNTRNICKRRILVPLPFTGFHYLATVPDSCCDDGWVKECSNIIIILCA